MLNDYQHAEILKDFHISSSDIDDQRTLHFDWTRDVTSPTIPTKVVSDVNFLCNYFHAKNAKDQLTDQLMSSDWLRAF